jgi:uncharacterized delta-60 repeat protein
MKLTDITFATGATPTDLVHIVITGDTSQSPQGSSYKATLQQVFDGLSESSFYDNGTLGSATTINWELGRTQKINLSGDTTLTMTGLSVGKQYQLLISQDVGRYSITYPNVYNLLEPSFFENGNYKVDPTFYTGPFGFDGTIYAIKVLNDGNILVGGDSNYYNLSNYSKIIKLETGGTIDFSFSVGDGFDNTVLDFEIQNDNKILVVGSFDYYDGNYSPKIVRLNSGGTYDSTFSAGTGFDSDVYDLALQSDGKILVGGQFNSYNVDNPAFIARINTDGTFDNTFATSGFNNTVRYINVLSDDSIVVGGQFTNYGAETCNGIVKLTSGGTIDTTFSAGTGFSGYANQSVVIYSIQVQSDGKILVGGDLNIYDGNRISKNITRLTTGGTVDNTFSAGTGFNGSVNSILIQNDGKILVGGGFSFYNGNYVRDIVRLNTDGTLDTSYVYYGVAGVSDDLTFANNGELFAGGQNIRRLEFNSGTTYNNLNFIYDGTNIVSVN